MSDEMEQMTAEQLGALSPLDKAIVVASNLDAEKPWEIAQRRLDILGYLRQVRAADAENRRLIRERLRDAVEVVPDA